MFDITSSKLLILAIVALIVVGPKDLPVLLRTVGRYLTFIRQHVAEFRAQLDEIMRDADLERFKSEIEGLGSDMSASLEHEISGFEPGVAPASLENGSALPGSVPEAPAAKRAIEEPGGLSGG